MSCHQQQFRKNSNNYPSYNKKSRKDPKKHLQFLSDDQEDQHNTVPGLQYNATAQLQLNFIQVISNNEILYSDSQIDKERLSSSQDDEQKTYENFAQRQYQQAVDPRQLEIPTFL